MPFSNRVEIKPQATNPRRPLLRPRAGTGRLGVISGYFQLSGIGAGLQTIWLTVASVMTRPSSAGSPKPWALIVACALLTFGFLRTSHLLDQRRRSGAQMATLCFLTTLAGVVTDGWNPAGFATIAVSAVGLGLTASVWKHLEKE
jgi:hypothetical protein